MKKIISFVLSLFVAGTSFGQTKKVMSAAEFEKAVTDKKAILIDARRPEEFNDGHIRGAVNANWQNQEDFQSKVAKLDKSKTVYVYCLSGVRSGKAADYLIKNGFSQVIGLDGGIEAWKAANKPLSKR